MEGNQYKQRDNYRREGYISWYYDLGAICTDSPVHRLFLVNLEVVDNPRRILHSCQLFTRYSDEGVPQTSKFFGSCNRSAQVPGHPEVAYEFPAQSPQNVISTVKVGRTLVKSLGHSKLTENDGHVDEEFAERITVRRQESR